jgi:hypothetical protein
MFRNYGVRSARVSQITHVNRMLGGFLKTAEKHPHGRPKPIGARVEPISEPPALANLGLRKAAGQVHALRLLLKGRGR